MILIFCTGLVSHCWLTSTATTFRVTLTGSIDSEMKKVEFLVPKNHHFNLEDLLTKPGKEQKFNTSWIFEMQDGYNIGVKAVIRNEWRLHDAEYLTYGEAKALTTKLNNFWQEEKKK